jgi:hypothetical protein
MIERRRRVLCWLVGSASLAVLSTGCGSQWRPPLYQKQDFHLQWVDHITVVPAVDVRIDRSVQVDLNAQLRDSTVNILTGKGYPTAASQDGSEVGTVTLDDLKNPEPAWIEHLGPQTARWVLVVTLVDVNSGLTFGSTGDAEVAGFLYDKKDGTLAWRDRGIAQVGQGGLLGMALVGAMDDAAISEALDHLFASFPERNKGNPYIPEPAPAAT